MGEGGIGMREYLRSGAKMSR